ncbi:MAG: hypothetical protein HZB79_07210 [Deltaproteobacteria bacterium]|nr:hypothetical protein [Deltaproteobacteria bacterium]
MDKILKVLAVVFAIAAIHSPAIAQEKPAPERLNQKPEIFVQLGHTSTVNSVSFSPDGGFKGNR